MTSEFFEQGDRERSELKLTPAVSTTRHFGKSYLQLADFRALFTCAYSYESCNPTMVIWLVQHQIVFYAHLLYQLQHSTQNITLMCSPFDMQLLDLLLAVWKVIMVAFHVG